MNPEVTLAFAPTPGPSTFRHPSTGSGTNLKAPRTQGPGRGLEPAPNLLRGRGRAKDSGKPVATSYAPLWCVETERQQRRTLPAPFRRCTGGVQHAEEDVQFGRTRDGRDLGEPRAAPVVRNAQRGLVAPVREAGLQRRDVVAQGGVPSAAETAARRRVRCRHSTPSVRNGTTPSGHGPRRAGRRSWD